MKKIKLTKDDAGARLDVFLADYLHKTRSQAQKLIIAGKIKINNQEPSKHYKIKADDELILQATKIVKRQIKPQALIDKIEVVEETKDYLVINKPAGLIVHPVAGFQAYTLVDWLVANYPDLGRVGDDLLRPGIVHRLDKEVSGLMVVARTQSAFDSLKQQFKQRTVFKQYQALVHGAINKNSDTIDFVIARSKSGKMVARSVKDEGRRALTEFQVMQRFIHYTLLLVTIKTGRTHQIRVHLSAYNHPVVGDMLYGNKISKIANTKLGLERLFLVATKLEFNDLAGQRQQFELPLPQNLMKILAELK